jgi:hypothetical protein
MSDARNKNLKLYFLSDVKVIFRILWADGELSLWIRTDGVSAIFSSFKETTAQD